MYSTDHAFIGVSLVAGKAGRRHQQHVKRGVVGDASLNTNNGETRPLALPGLAQLAVKKQMQGVAKLAVTV